MVVADDGRRQGAAGARDDLGGMRLHHQIADGEHEPALVDDDARAFALAAEVRHRGAVGIDEGLDAHDRGNQVVELCRLGLRGGGCGGGKERDQDDLKASLEGVIAEGAAHDRPRANGHSPFVPVNYSAAIGSAAIADP